HRPPTLTAPSSPPAPAPPETYPPSLHDALPIYPRRGRDPGGQRTLVRGRLAADGHRHQDGLRQERLRPQAPVEDQVGARHRRPVDRKSTRLNSSHVKISYAVFCLKKKKTHTSEA